MAGSGHDFWSPHSRSEKHTRKESHTEKRTTIVGIGGGVGGQRARWQNNWIPASFGAKKTKVTYENVQATNNSVSSLSTRRTPQSHRERERERERLLSVQLPGGGGGGGGGGQVGKLSGPEIGFISSSFVSRSNALLFHLASAQHLSLWPVVFLRSLSRSRSRCICVCLRCICTGH